MREKNGFCKNNRTRNWLASLLCLAYEATPIGEFPYQVFHKGHIRFESFATSGLVVCTRLRSLPVSCQLLFLFSTGRLIHPRSLTRNWVSFAGDKNCFKVARIRLPRNLERTRLRSFNASCDLRLEISNCVFLSRKGSARGVARAFNSSMFFNRSMPNEKNFN